MKIAFLSDTHLAPAAHAFNANCEIAAAWIDKQKADLTIHLGDITADGVNHADHFPTARDVLQRLATPLRLVPGNHDIGDNPVPGLHSDHALMSDANLAFYRDVFGEDRWVWRGGDWTILGLNAQLFSLGGAEEEAQFAWLEQALSDVKGPFGLALHKPLFRRAPDDAEIHPRYAPHTPRRRLMRLLEGRDLRFVVNGHTHQFRRLEREGVEHVWAPSTAFKLPDDAQEWIGDKVVGVLMLDLNADRHQFQLHVPNGMVQNDLSHFMHLFRDLISPKGKADEHG